MKKLYATALLVALSLVGCGGGGGDHERQGALRFIGACVKAPYFNVYVNGSKEVTALQYPGYSYYLPYGEGTEHVQFRPALSNTNSIDINVPLSALQYKTVVAYNDFANIRSLVLVDDRSVPPAGTCRLRMLNLAPSAGNVDVYVVAPGTNINNVAPTYRNMNFEANTGYNSITGAFYKVVVTRAGTKTALMDSGQVFFGSEETRTMFLLDKLGGGTPLIGLIQYDVN